MSDKDILSNPLAMALMGIGSTLADRGKNTNSLPGLLQGLLKRKDQRARDKTAADYRAGQTAKDDKVREMQIAQMKQSMQQKAIEQAKGQQFQSMIGEKYPQMSGLPKSLQMEMLKNQLAPKTPKQPASITEFLYGQENPAFAAHQEKMEKAGGTNITNTVGGRYSPGFKKMDEAYATSLAGAPPSSDNEKLISQLDDAYLSLGSSDNISGPVVGSIPDSVNKWFNPNAINTREQIEEAVQRNLRVVLGSQFTEQEGERLIKRAFNPNLQEGVNKDRLGRLVSQIKAAHASAKDKEQYFRENGTLMGWEGKAPSFQDFYSALDEPGKAGSGNGAQALPTTPTAQNLTPGTVYKTPKGELRWNGETFEDL